MFCTKCGSTLSENGVCPVCDVPVSDPINPELVFDQPPAASNPGKGLGITGMVMGIVSLLCNTVCSCMYGSVLGFPLSIVGLILSIIAKKKSKAAGCSNGMATAGFVMNLISVIMCALAILAIVAYLAFVVIMALVTGSAAVEPPTYYY